MTRNGSRFGQSFTKGALRKLATLLFTLQILDFAHQNQKDSAISAEKSNKIMKDTDWGVIQELKVEADTKAALKAALTIAMVSHSEVKGWREVGKGLVLYWGWDNRIERV